MSNNLQTAFFFINQKVNIGDLAYNYILFVKKSAD